MLIFFHISAQNIDCGYSLESPRIPLLTPVLLYKLGFKEAKIIKVCFRDDLSFRMNSLQTLLYSAVYEHSLASCVYMYMYMYNNNYI